MFNRVRGSVLASYGPLLLSLALGSSAGAVIDSEPPEDLTPEAALEMMTTNMTAAARDGLYEPYQGERPLKRRFEQDLAHRKQRSMFLLGPRGAGKTVFVESLAGQIEGKTIYSLNVNDLSAGTKWGGTLQGRMKSLLKNFVDHPERILFVDELHTITDLPGVRNTLKPLMSSGRLTLIGATTEDEYRDFLEADAPLIDRSQKYVIPEFNMDKLIRVLRGRAPGIRKETGIAITEDAIERAAKLIFLYYVDKSPGRTGVRLLETAAMQKAFDQRHDKSPYEQLALEDRVEAAESAVAWLEEKIQESRNPIDIALLKKKLAIERAELGTARAELVTIAESFRRTKLEAESRALQKQMAEFLRSAEAKATPTSQVNAVWDPYYNAMKRNAEINTALAELGGEPDYSSHEVTGDDVGRLVAADIGITNQSANETDVQKLKRLRDGLEAKFFGNPHVIDAICAAIGDRLLHVDKVSGPIGVFLLAGARGLGKTTVEEVLSEVWYGDKSRVVRISMNALRDSPAAIWGYEKGIIDSEQGGLIDALRRRIFSLLNLDEVEKGGRRVLDSFHQAFDKGLQPDTRGRMVNFMNTIVLMTGNLTGSWALVRGHYPDSRLEKEFGLPPGSLDGKSDAEKDQIVLKDAMDKAGFSESIQDRITGAFVLNPISRETAQKILEAKFRDQKQEIYQHYGLNVEFGDLAKVLVDHYYDANQSARYYERLRRMLINQRLRKVFETYLAVSNSGKFLPDSTLEFEFVPNAAKDATEATRADRTVATGEVVLRVTRPDPAGSGRTIDLEGFGLKTFLESVDKPTLSVGRAAGSAGHADDPRTDHDGSDGETTRVRRKRPPSGPKVH